MLRLALIENLRRVSARVAAAPSTRSCLTWAEQMAAVAKGDPKSLILVTADMARANPPMVSCSWGACAPSAGTESGLAAHLDRTAPFRVKHDHRTHGSRGKPATAADQVSISNSIGSLRILGATDWRKFVESVSAVEQILREESCRRLPRHGVRTRDGYRRTVEHIARRSSLRKPRLHVRQSYLPKPVTPAPPTPAPVTTNAGAMSAFT